MSQITKITSRIGTCRSGTTFDVPHELQLDDVVAAWKELSIGDRVDLFCMIEAKIAWIERSDNQNLENDSLRVWNRFVWRGSLVEDLRPHLEQLGLCTSPAYVQFGQQMLLL